MGQRGYAIAFFLVLLAACAGAFFGGRFLFQQLGGDQGQTAWAPPESSTPQPAPAGQAAVETATVPAAPAGQLTTPTVGARPTVRLVLTPFVPSTPTFAPIATEAPVTPTPAVTPTLTVTATPASAFRVTLARPVRNTSGDCSGSLIRGTVTDRSGKALPDVRIRITDEYGSVDDTKATKSGTELGMYDFPLFGPGRHFYLTVVDANGNPLSERVDVAHGVGAEAQATCHWVDWIMR